MKIRGKVVLITGSSDRVGRAIALTLAGKGAKVVTHYHTNKEKGQKTVAEITDMGENAILVQGELSKTDDWTKIKNEILTTYGGIDVLINNAAIFYKTPFFDSREEDWDNFMNINLKSIYLGSQIIGQLMYGQKSGKIINISDVSSETIWEDYIPYCVSKAGVVSMTKGLAKALAPHVTVNCIAPGTVLLAKSYDKKEEQNLINRTPLKRIGSPQDIANTALFLIEGSDFITGTTIKVDGGRTLT
jgi:pteridine reductase